MEGCGYRDLYEEFQALGVEIVGVGFDPPSETGPWVAEEGFQYEIWTDDARTLALTYGAATSATQSSPSRVSVILDAQGDVALEYPRVNFNAHPAEVLEDCQVLFQ
ncbi:MAG: redoxin domain-containing protein [Alphaproteobacteria bacterium]|nr:redoxin domain-containing protein [Alphaproteobacteria bacterium]